MEPVSSKAENNQVRARERLHRMWIRNVQHDDGKRNITEVYITYKATRLLNSGPYLLAVTTITDMTVRYPYKLKVINYRLTAFYGAMQIFYLINSEF
jgi:hypothetical protein